jgi:hypothetical protein
MGNGRGDPALAMDAHKGAHDNGNIEGGPVLAMDEHRDYNRNRNVREGPDPALGKETLYGTDTAAGAVADDTGCCHKQECNKRQRPRHHAELQQDGG